MVGKFRGTLIALAGLALGFGSAAAGAGGEIGVTLGIQGPDEHLTGEEDFGDQWEGIGGLRAEFFLNDHWGWMVDALHSEVETMFPQGDARMTQAHSAFQWYPWTKDCQGAWFLGLGGGWMWVDMEQGSRSDFDRPFASIGLGQRFLLGESATLRWEVRGDHTFYELADVVDEDMVQMEGLVSLSFPWGGSSDTDGDGVNDKNDRCPNTPLGALVDLNGCALDGDGDGVPDGLDQCDGPKGALADASGCPIDSDGDGVYDGLDRCPKTPRGAKVDAGGCPIDSDGDGVADGIDREENTPAGAVVDEFGRGVDSDGDGVYDGIDLCADTPAGTEVDARGCQILFTEDKQELVLEGVTFETNSDVLTADGRAILNRVAGSLKANPDVKVEVGGHTDSQGRDAYNMELSTKRAESVMRYLMDRGVSAAQLAAKGYGETRPVADNGTAEGRAQNRRVELKRAP